SYALHSILWRHPDHGRGPIFVIEIEHSTRATGRVEILDLGGVIHDAARVDRIATAGSISVIARPQYERERSDRARGDRAGDDVTAILIEEAAEPAPQARAARVRRAHGRFRQ